MKIGRLSDMLEAAKTDESLRDLLARAEEYYLLKYPVASIEEERARADELKRKVADRTRQMKMDWARNYINVNNTR